MQLQRRWFPARLLALLGSVAYAPQLLAKIPVGVLLARNAPPGIDPTGYLVSEKYDGVRALWDGRALRFRSGRTISAPTWFTAKLPATALDGELWLGRNQFDVLSGIVRSALPVDADWQRVQYMLFELPQDAGTFAQRAARLQTIARQIAWPALQAVEQFSIANAQALQDKLKATVQAGGEGLMLHLASAPVAQGRSDVLLKLKPVQDQEATVVAHIAGKGKYTGLLGALEVKTPSGQRFRLGTGLSDKQRQQPPAIGSTVTYTYQSLTPNGKPRFARFLRVHNDT